MASTSVPYKPILSVRGLKKSFGSRVAVDGIGFAIARGEVYGLLGPNGAGKTTSISMIAEFSRATAVRLRSMASTSTPVRLRAR